MSDTIQKGCKKSWTEMTPLENSDNRFCHFCSKEIFDITNKTKSEIDNLKKSNNNLCVKATIQQIGNSSHHLRPYKGLKKIGIISLLLIGNSFNNNIFSQNQNQKSYKIEWSQTDSDEIIIKGKTKQKKKIGIKTPIQTTIKIYNQEGLQIKQIETDKKGKFKINIPKKILGETYSIISEARGFKSVKISKIKIEDASFKIIMEREDKLFYIGYF